MEPCLILTIPFVTALLLLFLLGHATGLPHRTRVRAAFLPFTACLFAICLFELFVKLHLPHRMLHYLTIAGLSLLSMAGVLYLRFILALVERSGRPILPVFVVFALVSAAVAWMPGMFTLHPETLHRLNLVVIHPLYAGVIGFAIIPPVVTGTVLCLRRYRQSRVQRERRVIAFILRGTVVSAMLTILMIVVVPILLPRFSTVFFYSSIGLLVHAGYFFIAVVRLDLLALHLEQQCRHTERLESIGRLAGGVAHDFNNQLTGIMGCADLLRLRLPEDDDNQQLVSRIATSANHSADIVRQLLLFARTDKERNEPVSLHSLVGEVVALMSHSVSGGIRIEADLQAASSIVCGDPSHLQNAVLNLGMNACDAMPDGGVLKFVTRNVDDGHVLLEVIDTGCGMDSATRQQIFDPFFTTKPVGKGTGLGLSTVLGTVRSMGGSMEVDSHPGRGSTFRLRFPCLPAAPAAEPSKRPG